MNSAATLDLLRDLLTGIEPPVAARLWDGSSWTPDAAPPRLTIVVRRPTALRRLLRPGSEAALAEAYLFGDLDLEGDIFCVAPVARAILSRSRSLRERLGLAFRLAALHRGAPDARAGDRDGAAEDRSAVAALRGTRHSPERDRAAVTHHYDLSNRFFSLFLDPAMVYTCAVFAHAEEDLAAAQRRKLDVVCRKLRLKPGERFLDIGCGWGALLMHAAREYGVTAVGITLSERQAELARERINIAGLTERCSVEVRDYRAVAEEGSFDKIASLGMFEHVGGERAVEYFQTVRRALRPGGAYLHHAISTDPRVAGRPRPTLSHRYVFPDHDLIPLGEALSYAEHVGLEVRDVENLREHYALTLRRWLARLDAHFDEAVQQVGEPTVRAWRLVFAGAAHDFEAGRHRIHQTLLVNPREDGKADVPLQRNDWYS